MNSRVSDHTPLITNCEEVVIMNPNTFKLNSMIMQHSRFSYKMQKVLNQQVKVHICINFGPN